LKIKTKEAKTYRKKAVDRKLNSTKAFKGISKVQQLMIKTIKTIFPFIYEGKMKEK
jgi:hypothetical protein